MSARIAWEIEPLRFALARPLATAHGEIRERVGWVLTLRDAAGHSGRGEAAPLPGFGLESAEAARAALERAAKALPGAWDDLDASLDAVEAEASGTPSARGALDTALHGLFAARAGAPLAEWLAGLEGRSPRTHVECAALLRGSAPAELVGEARRALAAGRRALKLKIAAGGDDVARAAAVRAVCPDGVELRLDANGAWREDEARRRLADLAPLRPSYVEQPVIGVEGLARLRGACGVAIAADESLCSLDAARALAEAGAADVWVLKPAVVGGLRPARRIAALGRESGVDVVVGGFLDGPVGAAAARALAAALPGERPAGLDPA